MRLERVALYGPRSGRMNMDTFGQEGMYCQGQQFLSDW